MAWFLGNARAVGQGYWSIASIVPLMIWSAVWTGLALWHAAKRGEKWWFILFLFVHTAGVAEILYLVFVVKAFRNFSTRKKKRS